MAKDGIKVGQVCTCEQLKKFAVNSVINNCFDTQKGILENYLPELEASAEQIRATFAPQTEAAAEQ